MNTYVTTGLLKDGVTLLLDQPLPISEGRVRVTVQSVASGSAQQPLEEYLADLRARQAARGHVPRSREEIDAQVREERESWD
jgi:hypothetical protein